VSLICENPPERPENCIYTSIAGLYAEFENIFLVAEGGRLASACGHTILVFDHHFFHLAAVRTATEIRLFMRDEKDIIRATTDGHGKYLIDKEGSRARHLRSAKATMIDPDEVWIDNPKATSATWVYVKEFSGAPYPLTVAFMTLRPEENDIIVPVSSFPCRKGDIKKWRQSKLIYQKHVQPPE
jgi:phage-Barnase-EndoU-ColicinE5/D-RelE like nuclease2